MISLLRLAEKSNMSAGTAATIGVCGDLGFGIGGGVADLGNLSGRAAGGTVLLGHALGLLASQAMIRDHPYTAGDARVLETAWMLGAGGAAALTDAFGSDNEDLFVLAAMAGSATGFGIGHTLTRNTNFTESQGSLIALGTVGGALTGAGITYVIKGGKGDERLYLGLATVGAVAGFGFTYKALAPHAEKKTSSWDLRIAPQPLTALSSLSKVRLVPGIGAHLTF
jgi:hypothetical protein